MTTITNADGTNDTRGADLTKLIRKLGAESANSALAKPQMAIAIVNAANDGVLGEDDAEATYNTYLAGRQSVTRKSSLAAGVEDAGSVKANVSKNRQLIKLGLLPDVDGPALIDAVVKSREAQIGGDHKIKPPFDCMVDAAREQLKTPTQPLDEEQIAALCRKPESAEKTIIDKLIDDYKRLHKRAADMADEGMNTGSIDAAVSAIADAITEAGGEVPPMTKEEKEAAAAMAFLAADPAKLAALLARVTANKVAAE